MEAKRLSRREQRPWTGAGDPNQAGPTARLFVSRARGKGGAVNRQSATIQMCRSRIQVLKGRQISEDTNEKENRHVNDHQA